MQLKTYDPKSVFVIVGGVQLGGFSENSVVKIHRNDDSFDVVIGADGSQHRRKTNNKSGTVTVSLMQSSGSNLFMSAMALLDENGGVSYGINVAGIFPLLIKDNSLNLYTAQDAWIKKPPDGTYDLKATSREWVIETGELIWFEGGN